MKTYFYTYVYDEAGQLVRENMFEDNKTIIYVYDIGGNIVSKTEYEYTLGEITENMSPKKASNYTYGDDEYKDLLTGYTFTESSTTVNSELTYDAIGNVTSFNGNTFTWTAGRQLESSTTEENQLIKYFYNENGFLTRMDMYEDGGATYSGSMAYIWDGDRLVSRSFLDLQSGQKITARIIYDADGDNVGIVISNLTNGEFTGEITLLYRKNLQGDITGLINASSGELVAAYTYDAYGTPSLQPVNDNQLSVIASFLFILITPQLYRGYVYSIVGDDVCYYLGSRFYSPKLGRFLNADKHTDTGTGVNGTNMFAYCNNNPVMFVDPTGEAISIGWIVAMSTIIGAIIGAVIGYSIVKKNGYTVKDGWKFWNYILGGIAIGGVSGTMLGYIGGTFFSAAGYIYGSTTGVSAATMEIVRRLGALGEQLAGIVKNTTRIPSLTGTASYRIPDVLDIANKIIGDVKYVNSLSFTSQLKDFYYYAKSMGYQFVLYIKPETRLSSTLKELIDAGEIIVFFITKK